MGKIQAPMNSAAKTAKDIEATKKAIDRSMTAPKVKRYTLEEWEAMLEDDRAKYGNDKHNWHEGNHENS